MRCVGRKWGKVKEILDGGMKRGRRKFQGRMMTQGDVSE